MLNHIKQIDAKLLLGLVYEAFMIKITTSFFHPAFKAHRLQPTLRLKPK